MSAPSTFVEYGGYQVSLWDEDRQQDVPLFWVNSSPALLPDGTVPHVQAIIPNLAGRGLQICFGRTTPPPANALDALGILYVNSRPAAAESLPLTELEPRAIDEVFVSPRHLARVMFPPFVTPEFEAMGKNEVRLTILKGSLGHMKQIFECDVWEHVEILKYEDHGSVSRSGGEMWLGAPIPFPSGGLLLQDFAKADSAPVVFSFIYRNAEDMKAKFLYDFAGGM